MKHPRNLTVEEHNHPLAVERRKLGPKFKTEPEQPEIVVQCDPAPAGIRMVAIHPDGRKTTRTLPSNASPEAIDHARAQLEYQLRAKVDRLGTWKFA